MKRTKEAAFETREGILDAAEHQFIERGVSRTSLEHIARAAGVTRGAVYWHFGNKAELFNAMMARVRLPLENSLQHIVETATTIEDLERHCISSFVELQGNSRLRRVYAVLLLKCEFTDQGGHHQRLDATLHTVAENRAAPSGFAPTPASARRICFHARPIHRLPALARAVQYAR